MLSADLTDSKHYQALQKLMREGNFGNEYLINLNIFLMLQELVLSIDGLQETIAKHE